MDSSNNKRILTLVVIFLMSLTNGLYRFDVAVYRTVTISSSNDFRNGIRFFCAYIRYKSILVHSKQAKQKLVNIEPILRHFNGTLSGMSTTISLNMTAHFQYMCIFGSILFIIIVSLSYSCINDACLVLYM